MTSGNSTVAAAAPGIFAWLACLWTGAVLVDQAYAGTARQAGLAAQLQPVFGEIADLLLLLASGVMLAGIAALAAAWPVPRARVCLLAGLALLGGEFLLPMLAGTALQAEPAWGAWLRLAGSVLISTLALVGLWQQARAARRA